MNGLMRALGRVLRLVGISSPEDAGAGPKRPQGAPSWRDAEEANAEEREEAADEGRGKDGN